MNRIVLTQADYDTLMSEKSENMLSGFKDLKEFQKVRCEDIAPVRLRDDDKGNRRYALSINCKASPTFQAISQFLNGLTVEDIDDGQFPSFNEQTKEVDYSYIEPVKK